MEHLVASAAGFLTDEQGVTAVEYGLLAGLLVLAIVATIGETGSAISAIYTEWTNAVLNAIGA